jgi:hypothetical protein
MPHHMKITPDLFTQASPPARPAREASQARLAFEAMLSAGAARQTVIVREEAPRATIQQSAPNTQLARNDSPDAPPSRPGRVLDIRV